LHTEEESSCLQGCVRAAAAAAAAASGANRAGRPAFSLRPRPRRKCIVANAAPSRDAPRRAARNASAMHMHQQPRNLHFMALLTISAEPGAEPGGPLSRATPRKRLESLRYIFERSKTGECF